jgi:hypothetical protein
VRRIGYVTRTGKEKVIATLRGVSTTNASWGQYRVTYIRAERLHWGHTPALQALEGATVSSLVGPRFAVLRALHVPADNPQPGLTKVLFALIHQVPEGAQGPDVFSELLQNS